MLQLQTKFESSRMNYKIWRGFCILSYIGEMKAILS